MEESKNITLTTNEDSDGTENKIIEFISDDLSDDMNDTNQEIKIEEIQFNVDSPTTKNVVENNNCSINLDKNSELLDTGRSNRLYKIKKSRIVPKSNKEKLLL